MCIRDRPSVDKTGGGKRFGLFSLKLGTFQDFNIHCKNINPIEKLLGCNYTLPAILQYISVFKIL